MSATQAEYKIDERDLGQSFQSFMAETLTDLDVRLSKSDLKKEIEAEFKYRDNGQEYTDYAVDDKEFNEAFRRLENNKPLKRAIHTGSESGETEFYTI